MSDIRLKGSNHSSKRSGKHVKSHSMNKQKQAIDIEDTRSDSQDWLTVEMARHPSRPHPEDYIEAFFSGYTEMHGDRQFGDDPAIMMGMAVFAGKQVMVIGNRKGRTLKERVERRFGMPNPEGYRKALRAMKFAEKFKRPIIVFIDLTAANPGIGAEERGQGEAIARNLREMSRLRVPTIAIITGEGGSGGALGLAIGDRVLMMENSIYTVIPAEGAASIIWRDVKYKREAAAALRCTSADVFKLGCVDEVIPEPQGGAHKDPALAIELVKKHLLENFNNLAAIPLEQLLQTRYDKFRNIAQFYTSN